jgi:peptide/nickel transport system substrate-binding protein
MEWFKKIFFALTRNERISFIAALSVAFISFIAAMWLLVFQITKIVPVPGGDYTAGMVGQPEYINPVTATNMIDQGLVKMIYSNIYDLASEVNGSSDGRTWTVRLKENLRWHDGEKLTSDDVIFTVQSIGDQAAKSPLFQSWQGVAISRVSELALQFSLANPYAYFASNLKKLYILPKHLFANTPTANWRLSDYNLKPIGSGPYGFDAYDKRLDGVISGYHLKTFSKYSGTKPLIDHFNFQFFGNTTDMIKSFNVGRIDGMGGLNANDLAMIDRPYDLLSWRTPTYYAVFWNQSKSLALQDKAVRTAMSMAIDRDQLVKQALKGEGKVQYGPISEDAAYFVRTDATSSLDLASTTLTDAGWKIGPDGFRIKIIQKTPVSLTVNLTVPKVDFLEKTASMIKCAWEQLGIKVSVATFAPTDILNDAVKNRNYEALLFGNVLGPNSDLYAFWNSSQRFYPGLNLSIYNNSKVDSYISTASTELDDVKRAALFLKAQNAIVSDAPAAFLYSPNYLYVTTKSVRGATPHFIPDPSDLFRDASTWYLNTARVLK